MYCARCGSGLGEEQICSQCGWTFNETDMFIGPYEQPSTGDGAAITSLICGVLSWITAGGCGIVPIVGIIFGMVGLKSRQSEIAVAGIVINVAVLILAILFFAFMTLMAATDMPPPRVGTPGRCC